MSTPFHSSSNTTPDAPTLTDSTGGQPMASLLNVAPGQLNYVLPGELLPGPVTAAIKASEGHQYVDSLYVQLFAPSLFLLRLPVLQPAG